MADFPLRWPSATAEGSPQARKTAGGDIPSAICPDSTSVFWLGGRELKRAGFFWMRDAGVDTQEARLRAADRVVKSNFQLMIYIRITLTLTLAKGLLLSKMYEHVMKALRNLALALMVPVLASSLSAAEKPEIVDEYLPVGKMAEAAAVSVVLDESLQPFMEKIDGVFASLPDKDKKELVGQIVPGQPVPYDERLGWTKDEYAKYLECWKLKQVQEVAPVALGIFASGERNIWDLAAVAQQGPLPMSTLKYDSSTKSWISPNGTLTLKGDVSYDELNVYGAWSGKEWTMEKLCERANMEKSQFYSYYKKFFSSTPHNDLIEVRLDKAKNLLTNQALSISQTAELCGFSNLSHFSRYFKKHCGCSPKEWRLGSQQNNGNYGSRTDSSNYPEGGES